MAELKPKELKAFMWMQGRMVELLLRHYAPQFRKIYESLSSSPDELMQRVLKPYRDLAVLFYLKDELFGNILPRIKRRLSFELPRQTIIEPLPTRGRVDWVRTARASLGDEPPLEAHTRQRQRHFATPENLLAVITILQYKAAAEHLIEQEKNRDLQLALRHPLHDIVDSCTRELAFLQFAGLVNNCQEIISGHSTSTVEELEISVAGNLMPGHNSAYSKLLEWRELFNLLQLLDPEKKHVSTQMLGVDPDKDNKLYELWLYYELGEYLKRTGHLLEWKYSEDCLEFNWGEKGQEIKYRLKYNKKWHKKEEKLSQYWENAPGIRPDFYIERTDRNKIQDGTEIIWHAPGFILDAKYYKEKDSDSEDSNKVPSGPVKRMIADLQLTGERHGALLFAFHAGGEPSTEEQANDKREIFPNPKFAQFIPPDIKIITRKFQPKAEETAQYLDEDFEELFKFVHNALKAQVEIRCRGLFLDSLSTNARGEMASAALLQNRAGTAFGEGELEKLLLCPKPHVAPWRVDIVHLEKDCLNSNLCHIRSLLGEKKPQRIVKLEDIKDAIRSSIAGQDNEEAVMKVATQQVLAVTQRFVELIQPRLEDYQNRIKERLDLRDEFDKTPLLNATQRNTLSLAYFLEEQIRRIGAENFAGPALLYTGVLEEITQKTIHKKRPTLYTTDGSHTRLGDTLGTIGNCKDYGGTNWPILQQEIVGKGFWNEEFILGQTHDFSKWVDLIRGIVPMRNKAAHKAFIDSATFQQLVALYFGSPSTGYGAFSILLLAWKVLPLPLKK